ncbi:helix-turn-helix transcriptional regulator [Salinicoccus roseus]|uniref:Transcriptional regulator n=1 Tax=Salinicoccus roseus TaxID=45670 RepID=A0A265E3X8_9STAP|nr:helix-turn-helix transcriptional regulator [Salinicoccus roseus]OZT76215.1 transcriptional regulator [Salinicoccus roseus]
MKNSTDNRIREYRKKAGYTQQQLAEKVGVTRLTIISLEKKRYEASVGLAIKISRVFACTVEELFIVEG